MARVASTYSNANAKSGMLDLVTSGLAKGSVLRWRTHCCEGRRTAALELKEEGASALRAIEETRIVAIERNGADEIVGGGEIGVQRNKIVGTSTSTSSVTRGNAFTWCGAVSVICRWD